MAKRGGDFAQDTLDYRSEEIDFQTRSNALFRHNGVPILTASSNITLQPFGAAPNASGASLVGTDFTLQPASDVLPGGVIVGPQSFGGDKTIVGDIFANNLSGGNTGDVTLTPVGAAPAPEGASLVGQVLTLQPADGANPGVVSTAAQDFSGPKTFFDDATFSADVSMTGLPVAPTLVSQVLLVEPTGEVSRTIIPSIAPIGAVPNAAGCSVDFVSFQLQPASAAFGGVLTAGAQSIAGPKTFTGAISASNLSGVNSGDVSLAPVGAVPNANGASLAGQTLTLQPASDLQPGVVSTAGQNFSGNKQFFGNVIAQANIGLPAASTALAGTITKGASRFLSSPGTCVNLGTNAGNFNGSTDCVFVGDGAGALTTAVADNNTGCGHRSLSNLLGGIDNTCLGENSGAAYLGGESRNLCLASAGVLGDNNQIRIGNSFHTKCTVRGVSGVVVAGGAAVLCNAAGLFGTIPSTQTRKRQIEDVGDEDVQRYLSMRARKFKMIGDDTDEQHWGVVVEETDEIMPELSLRDEEGKFSSFKYQELDGLVLAVVKKLNQRIAALEAQIPPV